MHERFDPLATDYLADPFPILAAIREETPVFYSSELDMWPVTRHEDIKRIFTDYETFSGAITQTPVYPLAEEAKDILAAGFHTTPTVSNCDPPKHTRVRAHNVKAFSARRIAVLEPTIRAYVTEMIDRILHQDRFDIVQEVTFPLPATIVFNLIGFPESDMEMLKGLAINRMAFTWGRSTEAEQVRIAKNQVDYWQYCTEFVASRLAEPKDDFTSDLIRTHLADPDELSVDEITNVVHALSFAGHETTTNVSSSMIQRLLTHREQWEELCADPALIPKAIEEGLRFDPSLFTWRRITTKPVSIGGVEVPAGAKLLLLVGSANHDPAKFPDPEAFNIHRSGAQAHLTFGRGIHSCFGAPLARLEMQIMLEELTARMPGLRLVEDQDVQYHVNACFRGPVELWLDNSAHR
ncbi:cytochrome P450 [Saccharopolyspora erythraea]|uniref:Cytochrome P450 CYP116 n=2 Tax=Saccharopolyspora erythraea TaxID=1836 RepID=A4FCY1_SACEN|nr:cytochrome P450 [Saccharopolyspora erythraea]EQD82439.1 cytochrome P450 [Saccharopolyspora erythraea D]QRK92256.1 cytochrome P450 [Saccharopolyspora erythraea]CAM01906.1 cytochrome P450 CYP116 [Saccharopolyspora erythraea NRRL 2338]